MTFWQKFADRYFGIDKELDASVKAAAKRHAEFLLSLDERQREYYSNMHGQGRIKWDVVRLEKRIHDLEQKAKID